MRGPLILGAALVTLGLGVSAQQSAPQQPTATFRATSDLIVQTVTVKDKSGQPVLGLTPKDFVVTEDGQPQDIAFVEYEALDAAPAAPQALTTGTEPPPVTAPTSAVTLTTPDVVSVPGAAAYRGRRLLVLYLDLSKMPLFDQLRTFDSADRYITTEMTAVDLVAVMVYDGAGVRLKQNFTDDRTALRTTIQTLADAAEAAQNGLATNFDPGGAFGEDDDTFNIFSTDRQLAALQTAVTDLGPLPEVKTLVYLGSGLSLNGIDNQAQLRATVNAAVRANVTLNPIDARGLVASAPLGDATRASPGGVGMFSGTLAFAQIANGQQAQDTLYALAKDTGGKAMFDNNDLALGILQAARAVTGYYMIGYYTNHLIKNGKYRHVTIALADGRVATLSFRPGYFGDKEFSKFTKADKERQLEDALRLENPVTDIPMAAEVNYFQLNRAEYYVPVSVRMPGSELTRPKPGGTAQAEIDMIGEVKDPYGVTIRNMRDLLAFTVDAAKAADVARRPIQYETGFTLLPGSYVIKVLARDATTGHIGTLEKAFTVPNLERVTAALPISTVVLSNQRVAATDALYTVKQKISTDAVNPLIDHGQKLIPSVTRTFSLARPLLVFLQAYERDATTERPLVAFVTFYLDGVKAFETELQAIAEGWNPTSKAVPIRFSIPLESLKPGSYDCQVTVLDPSGSRAAFWRTPLVIVR
ncbi:MAG TPA: VWA domain-containing protein [Vicinamibacterales bacterium]